MFILPFEHLTLGEYEHLLHNAPIDPKLIQRETENALANADAPNRAIVNACIYVFKTKRGEIAVPQRKLRPAKLEEPPHCGRWTFLSGGKLRILEGNGIRVASVICFDFIARDPATELEPLDVLAPKGLTYLFVPECNPTPLHATYTESCASLFRHKNAPQAVFFANVAAGTPLPLPNPQLGFSRVIGRIGKSVTADPERVAVLHGFLENSAARTIDDLQKLTPSLSNPDVRTVAIRPEPTMAIVEVGTVNVRESRATATVKLHRFLGSDIGWRPIYRLEPFQKPQAKFGIPTAYVEERELHGVHEQRERLRELLRVSRLPIWVTGDPGFGKTALVAHTLREFGDRRRVVWVDLGDLQHEESALREALLLALGASKALTAAPAEQIATLVKLLEEDPTVVVLDSYERWAGDRPFPNWIEQLVGWNRVVITSRFRPADRAGDPADPQRQADPHLPVRKLDLDEAYALVCDVAGAYVDREAVDVFANATERSPLACVWLGELFRHAPDEVSRLFSRLPRGTAAISVVYEAMLDGLSPLARKILGVVCQLPAPVADSDLTRICGVKSPKIHAAVSELERRSLIMPRNGGRQFRHPLVKQYWAHDPVNEEARAKRAAERAAIHDLLLAWAKQLLDDHGGDLNPIGFKIIEERWGNVGFLLRQIARAPDAADRRLFLHMWERVDTALWSKNRWRERVELGRSARDISHELRDCRRLGRALFDSIAEVEWNMTRDRERAEPLFKRARRLFRRVGDFASYALVEWYRSRMLAELRLFDAALEAVNNAVTAAHRSGDIRTLGLAHHGRGNVYRRMKRSDAAIAEFMIGRGYFGDVGDEEMMAVASRRIGGTLMQQGEHGQALLELEESIDGLRELELDLEAAESAVFHAEALLELGEIDDSEAELRTARELLSPLGSAVRNEEIDELEQKIAIVRARLIRGSQ